MSEIVEKTFKFYQHLPNEIRMMTIDEMHFEDRCRFTRCSTLCNTEAKASKNYILGLEISCYTENNIYIEQQYGNDKVVKNVTMNFTEKQGLKYIRYVASDKPGGQELFRKDLEFSTNLIENSAQQFQELLRIYQNRIKYLALNGRLLSNAVDYFNFEIGNWKNLESLSVDGDVPIQPLLSKLKNPLKSLTVWQNPDLAICEQIYQVKHNLLLKNTPFNYEQLLRLRAPSVLMPLGDLSVMDIFNFIRSWQNGTLEQEIKRYEWVGAQDFAIDELLALLEVDDDIDDEIEDVDFEIDDMERLPESREISFVIDHNQNPEMKGILTYNNSLGQLIFMVR